MVQILLFLIHGHRLSIHFSVHEHSGCCHVLATVNSAALNIGVPVSFWFIVLSGSCGNSVSSFTSIHFSIMIEPTYVPSSSVGGFSFLHSLSSIFSDGHSDQCEVRMRASQWLSSKESACNAGAAGDTGSIPGSGRSPGGGHGNPLQYSCLENPMDSAAWWATVHGVAKSQTRLKRLSPHTFCAVVPHCSFDLCFSNNQQCWSSLHVPIGHLYFFFGEVSL